MFDFKKSKSLITILLSVMVSSCAYDQDQTEVDMDVVHQGDYGIWKQSVTDLFSSDYFPASQIRHKYAQTHAYHPVFMGQAWMNDMGELAAQNPAFREQLLDEVSGGREAAYAQKLLYNPQAITSLSSSRSAFRDVLNYVSYNNARYSDNQTRLEAYARKQPVPNIHTQPKPVSYFSMYDYSSTSATDPSVMERILNIAAFKVMKLDEDENYKNHLSALSQSHAMTNCFGTAKRNSQQCQAAAHDHYDLSYCMAQHNISEVAGCFSWMLP